MKKLLQASTFCLAALGLSSASQAFPDRPVTMVVPFGAGGGSDIMARTIAPELSAALGVDVVVKNTAGAGGTIGAAEVAAARPDGYTIGLMPVGPLTTQTNLRQLPYDITSFDYICRLYSAPYFIAVATNAPYDTLDELSAWSRENPNTLNFAVAGLGGIPHISGLATAKAAELDVEFIPFAGDTETLKALLDGTAQIVSANPSFVMSNSGQVKPIMVLSEERLEGFEDVPTARELGHDIVLSVWGGLVVPMGTPDEVRSSLEAACDEVANSESFQNRLEELNQPLDFAAGEEFRQFVQNEFEGNRVLLTEAGLVQ